MLGVAIRAEKRGEEQKLSSRCTGWWRGPVRARRPAHGQNETVLYGLGDLHLRVMLQRMTERYAWRSRRARQRPVSRDDHSPAEGHHRHKKQTGGAGSWRGVPARRATARGSGFEFVDDVWVERSPASSSRRSRRACGRCWSTARSPASSCRTCASACTTVSTRRGLEGSAFVAAGRRPSLLRSRKPADRAGACRARGDHHARGFYRRRDQRPVDATCAHQRTDTLPGGRRRSRRWCRRGTADYLSRLKAITGGEGSYTMD